MSTAEGTSNTLNMEVISREIELMRRERAIMERELRLAKRKIELLRNSSQASTSSQQASYKIGVKSVIKLCDFDGAKPLFCHWECQVKLLCTTYQLDDNASKVIIGARVKGKALQWLHSSKTYRNECKFVEENDRHVRLAAK